MKKAVFILLSCLLLSLGSYESALSFQASLRIKVYSVNTGKPIADVEIKLVNNKLEAKTDSTGLAEINKIANPIDVLSIQKYGYEGQSVFVTLSTEEVNEFSTTLTPSFDEIQVEAEAQNRKLANTGYYERKGKAAGTFLDKEDLEKKRIYRASDIFTGIAGVKLERIDGNLVLVSTRQIVKPDGAMASAGPCPLRILVDGSEIAFDISNLNNSLDVNQIQAVEVYNNPSTTPVQYNRFASCGVVLIWTR